MKSHIPFSSGDQCKLMVKTSCSESENTCSIVISSERGFDNNNTSSEHNTTMTIGTYIHTYIHTCIHTNIHTYITYFNVE